MGSIPAFKTRILCFADSGANRNEILFFGIVINGEIHPSSLQLFWEMCVLLDLLAEHLFFQKDTVYTY